MKESRGGSLRRARMAGLGVVIATFVAGGLAGAAFERVLLARDAPRACAERDGRRGSDAMLRGMDLTEGQRAAVDSILDRRRGQIAVAWAEVKPRMKAITDSTRTEIAAILTPEQREEYERLWREGHSKRDAGPHRGEVGRGPAERGPRPGGNR